MSISIAIHEAYVVQGQIGLSGTATWRWADGPATYFLDLGQSDTPTPRTRSTGAVSNAFDAGYPSISGDASKFPYSDSITARLVVGAVTVTESVSLRFDPLAAAGIAHLGTAAAEVVFAGVFADTLSGAAGDDLLAGRGGDDHLASGAGDDGLQGGDGHDTLSGADGDDSLYGGHGDDRILGGAGNDILLGGGPAETRQSYMDGSQDDSGADILLGGAGADTLDGGAEDDRLHGGTAADAMFGRAGSDLYWVDDIGDRTIEFAGGGTDTVRVSLSTWTLAANVERLIHTGSLAFLGTGNDLANRIAGGTGADMLVGLTGNDVLLGGGGNDTIWGGTGRDILAGGGGADSFRFADPTEGSDLIRDFATGLDRLEVSAFGFDGGLSAGALGAAQFVANVSGLATAGYGQFIHETDAGKVWWDANGTGAGMRTLLVTFVGTPALDASDIIVIG